MVPVDPIAALNTGGGPISAPSSATSGVSGDISGGTFGAFNVGGRGSNVGGLGGEVVWIAAILGAAWVIGRAIR